MVHFLRGRGRGTELARVLQESLVVASRAEFAELGDVVMHVQKAVPHLAPLVTQLLVRKSGGQ